MAISPISGIGGQVLPGAIGKGSNVSIFTDSLVITNSAQLNSSTFGQGDAGDIAVKARNRIILDGVGSNGISSFAGSQVEWGAVGKGGDINLSTGSLVISNGAQLGTKTFGQGDAGNISITARDAITFDGIGSNGQTSSAQSSVISGGVGRGGDISINAGSLKVVNGAVLISSTLGQGDAGNISITARDAITFDGGSNGRISGAGSQVALSAVGNGGNLTISSNSLSITNGAVLSSNTFGQGDAGRIMLQVREVFRVDNGTVATFSLFTSGGSIDIAAKSIRLSGNGNIISSVFSGAGGGGNITLTADSIIALGDSNILAFARDGKGGNITLNTRAFFGQNYRPAPRGTNPFTLIGNGRVDINASGTVSGLIITPDTTFIQNGLTSFSQVLVDSSKLLANSCIVRRNREMGSSFFITGSGGLPVRPGDLPLSSFPTGDVRNVEETTGTPQNSSLTPQNSESRPWKIGDPIVEPQGVYQLPNGELVMSRECE